jgi:predicted nucleic acid-binding protein
VALKVRDPYGKVFLERGRLLLDSHAVIAWVNDPSLDTVFAAYTIVYCTVSMLEVGFGVSAASDPQAKRVREIYTRAIDFQIDSRSLHQMDRGRAPRPSGPLVYNPGHNEWYAARDSLIRWMERTDRTGRSARSLQNDALIYSCAWNARAALVSENLKDFVRLNELGNRVARTRSGGLRHLPIYTIDDVRRAASEDVVYPDNLPDEMRRTHGL